jgi:hypothetical protein
MKEGDYLNVLSAYQEGLNSMDLLVVVFLTVNTHNFIKLTKFIDLSL